MPDDAGVDIGPPALISSTGGRTMRRQRYRLCLFSIAACAIFTLWAAWIAFAQQQRQPDANALRNAGQSGEWRTYGGDYAETRYSPLGRSMPPMRIDWGWHGPRSWERAAAIRKRRRFSGMALSTE